MPITVEQKQIVKSTVSILRENGKEITSIFYKDLFMAHPELLSYFNQTDQALNTQPFAFANALYFIADNIDRLEVLMPDLNTVAHKHRALTIQPEHYSIVGKCLIQAISKFLGDKATTSTLDAWTAAYYVIASILIDIEKKLYDQLGKNENDKGFIPFMIVKKEKIANGPIYSYEIKRNDGGKMLDYHPGQYITLRLKKNGLYHNRHYGLVKLFNGKTYCVGIKQLINCEPKGIFSNEIIENYHVGDTILASLPAGTFSIIDDAKRHLFIAGGIGITVLSTMIEQLYKQGKSHTVTLIHCVPGKGHAAYVVRMRMCVPEKQYHLLYPGRHMLKGLIKKVVSKETHAYLCGTATFMNTVENHLEACNFPLLNVHINVFQPLFSPVKNEVKN
ncbi:unnamed protein product [Rotaria socialis]|uniref:nitric oxide dioxygenase n=1 Tax=Rotaria socialis TaxID=392032 RepID=A0A819XZY8_9BILA|nr:unnamed protein product [Rotaria socialis]CAF4142905.1 unnamed protein product [Rotaria socialis]